MLKVTALSIAPSLTNLFNISIRQGHLSECWKTSSVVPVPKSTGLSNVTNYRPICLLSIVSKILEHQWFHFHQYIINHLNEYHPLSNKQWGFKFGKSTTTALLSVTHDCLQALEAGKEVCSIFFDIRKAFDPVIHRLLVDKLTSHELDVHTISWITSYLTNQKQHVVVGGKLLQDVLVLSVCPRALY